MRLVVLATVTLLSALATATVSARRAENDHGCNARLKGLKTVSDPQQKLVNLHPKTTTVAAINALAQPHPTPKTRSTPFSRRVWRVWAQITEFKLEGDSDIHVVLYDDNAYLIAEMPATGCIPKKARDRRAMIAARKRFVSACGEPTDQWKPLGAVAMVSGVGFFDIPHSQKPHAQNFAELHPVTGIKIVTGC